MKKTIEQLKTETIEHRNDVMWVMSQVCDYLNDNAKHHDLDKFDNLECLQKALETKDFAEWDEYHMAKQRHHKEWQFSNQYNVNLFDLIETCVDGATACFRRNPNSNVTVESQTAFYEKAGYDNNLSQILANTFMTCFEGLIDANPNSDIQLLKETIDIVGDDSFDNYVTKAGESKTTGE